jgi:hypothetical protein
MAHSKKQSHLPSNLPELTTPTCPLVADLIDFALTRGGSTLGDRVRTHLLADNCNCCQKWVEQAMRHRTGPALDWTQMNVGPLSQFSPSTPNPDPTPIPENAKWQRRAFRDLETRLGSLESS